MKFKTVSATTDSENVAPLSITTPKAMDKTMTFESMEKDQKRVALGASPLQNQVHRDLILLKKKEDAEQLIVKKEEKERRKRKERKLLEERTRQADAEEEKRAAKKAKKQKIEKQKSEKKQQRTRDEPSYSSYDQHEEQHVDIQYPKTALPEPTVVESVYKARVGVDESGNLLKGKVVVEDLLLAICTTENNALKVLQAKLQKSKSVVGKIACERARSTVKEIQVAGVQALNDSREAEGLRRDSLKQKYSVNTDNWKKVSTLMEKQANLKAEERGWVQALKEVELRERALENGSFLERKEEEVRNLMDLEESACIDDSVESTSAQEDSQLACKVDETIQTVVSDMTLQADRINQTLRSVVATVEEGERVKRELYHGYTSNNMFADYKGKNDPKGLIRGMLN